MTATFHPPVDIPADILAWMKTQSQSAFIGDMLRLYQRKGGISQGQLDAVRLLMSNSPNS